MPLFPTPILLTGHGIPTMENVDRGHLQPLDTQAHTHVTNPSQIEPPESKNIGVVADHH